jgi:replicative DNA helicase
MQIVPLKKLAKKAAAEIKKYQMGDKHVVKTGRPWLDDIFPVINGTVITIAAGSGVGKSTELQKVIKNILNKDLNPEAEDYIVLNISLEMKMLSLVLRGLSDATGKKKKDVLLSDFSEKERELANLYFESLIDDRQYVSQVPTTPKQFYDGCYEFLDNNRHKKSVFVAIDHIALIGSDGGEGKQQVIEHLIEYINDLKMEFGNVIFLLLSQLNGEIIKRAKDKDQMSQPKDSDLYYSAFTFQVSDYVVVISNPYKLGINEYSKLNASRYPHLSKFFVTFDSKGRGALKTTGVLYFHILKMREAEAFYTDIFAEELKLVDPSVIALLQSTEPDEDEDIPKFSSEGTLEKHQGNGFDNII